LLMLSRYFELYSGLHFSTFSPLCATINFS
jgi:hypothetical protein